MSCSKEDSDFINENSPFDSDNSGKVWNDEYGGMLLGSTLMKVQYSESLNKNKNNAYYDKIEQGRIYATVSYERKEDNWNGFYDATYIVQPGVKRIASGCFESSKMDRVLLQNGANIIIEDGALDGVPTILYYNKYLECSNVSGDDDDDSYYTLPIVETEANVVNSNYADVNGVIRWNGNKSSRNIKFLSWNTANKNSPLEWEASTSDNSVYTSVSGKINFTVMSGSETIELYKKGETVYYQVVIRDVKYKGGKQEVKGNVMSFVIE